MKGCNEKKFCGESSYSSRGAIGPQGLPGAIIVLKKGQGLQGIPGETGSQGLQGIPGETGIQGIQGIRGIPGETGSQGLQGIPGETGSGIKSFADFYALMPGDNSSTVAIGSRVLFPQNGPSLGITRVNASEFILPNIGIYEVMFQVSITEPGQLVIVINGAENSASVVGRDGRTSQIVGMSLIKTTTVNTIISINNRIGNSTALTITPLAGGKSPVSAHLIIKQIS